VTNRLESLEETLEVLSSDSLVRLHRDHDAPIRHHLLPCTGRSRDAGQPEDG
jgi:hypothetical protein